MVVTKKQHRTLEPVRAPKPPPPTLEQALEEHTRILRQTMEDIRDRTPVDGIRSRNCDGIVDALARLLADDTCDCDCHQGLHDLVKRYRDQ